MATHTQSDPHRSAGRRPSSAWRDDTVDIRGRCVAISISIAALIVVLVALFLL
ncbi:hypothetical protein [Williamsia sp. Leaf354]|uniref:hypothetical protein n=1 Tax=Williamsia sp. Leaf354 TaxID=1736349 RepID=UPI000A9215DA|nr:hypothetical protein [Williamsia sp. Leaf354]